MDHLRGPKKAAFSPAGVKKLFFHTSLLQNTFFPDQFTAKTGFYKPVPRKKHFPGPVYC
jgi:hypothetical protein